MERFVITRERFVNTTEGAWLQGKAGDCNRIVVKVRNYKRSLVITTEDWILHQNVVITSEGLVWLLQKVCDYSRCGITTASCDYKWKTCAYKGRSVITSGRFVITRERFVITRERFVKGVITRSCLWYRRFVITTEGLWLQQVCDYNRRFVITRPALWWQQ